MTYKIHGNGTQIDRLPSPTVLASDEVPAPVSEAFADWRDAVDGLAKPREILREATKVARENTMHVRGERERWIAESDAKVEPEREALKEAERDSARAARALVDVLEEHADEIRAAGARLALAAHAAAVDTTLDLGAQRGRFRQAAPAVPAHPNVDPKMVALQRGTNVQADPFEDLDRVNVAALVEVAGSDPVGFVEVVSRRGFRLHTTPRRAEALAGKRDGWIYADDEKEV